MTDLTPPRRAQNRLAWPIRSARSSRRTDDGFVALDILVGVFVLAILLLTVLMSIGPHRQRSYQASAVSDARQLGGRIEATLSDNSTLAAAGMPSGEDTLSDSLLSTLGVNLTSGIAVARYTPLSSTQFQVCLVHYSGSTVDAYALYDSTRGRVISSGRGAGPAACVPASAPPPPSPTSSPSPTSGPEVPTPTVPGPSTPPASSIDTPTNLQVTVVPGESKAAVSWDAVAGAAGYALYLDGASTPAWTGTTLTADLTGLSTGPHSVTVTARAGGDESTKSPPATFTIHGDNDFIANAHPIPDRPDAEYRTRDYSTAGTSVAEAGEEAGNNYYSRWWTITAPRDTHYYLEVVGPADGSGLGTWYYPEIYVWKTTATSTSGGLGATVVDSGAITPNRVWFDAQQGETFKVRVSTGGSNHDNRRYRLMVATGPLNDYAAGAETIPANIAPDATWRSPDTRPQYAATEVNEPSGSNTLWWNFTPSQSGTYYANIGGPSSGGNPYEHHTYMVWDTAASTPVDSLGTAYASEGRSYSSARGISFHAAAGKNYKLRVSGTTNTPFRLQVTRGPVNDMLATAAQVPALTAGTPWVSVDMDNTRAGAEPNEPTDNAYSMWWTYTPTTSGTLRVEVLAPTDGLNYTRYRRLMAYRTTSTDVTATGAHIARDAYTGDYNPVLNLSVTAGETYKIKMATAAGQFGRYRMQMTLS